MSESSLFNGMHLMLEYYVNMHVHKIKNQPTKRAFRTIKCERKKNAVTL